MNKTERLILESLQILLDDRIEPEIKRAKAIGISNFLIIEDAKKESNLPFEEALKEKGSDLHKKTRADK